MKEHIEVENKTVNNSSNSNLIKANSIKREVDDVCLRYEHINTINNHNSNLEFNDSQLFTEIKAILPHNSLDDVLEKEIQLIINKSKSLMKIKSLIRWRDIFNFLQKISLIISICVPMNFDPYILMLLIFNMILCVTFLLSSVLYTCNILLINLNELDNLKLI